MRKIRRLGLVALLALSTFLIGVFISRTIPALSHREPSAWQVLVSFDNQDLEGLDEQSGSVARKAINELAPHNEINRSPFEPRLFRTIENAKGEQRYILVEESPSYMVPGNAMLRVCVFDKAGHLLDQQAFSTGHRSGITSIKIRRLYQLEHPVLVVQGEYYLGALFYQYYALSGNQIVMIYNQTGYGFDPISYGPSDAETGPMIKRSADEWQRALESSDTVEILSALMWFTGAHSDINPAAPEADTRALIQKRLAELSESNNFWIRNAARSLTVDR